MNTVVSDKMQCHFCGGEMKKGKTTYTLNRAEYYLLIGEVPAWICSKCNETYFEEEVVENIQFTIGAHRK
jgi:YgiT-type zinc finger domain-containing protein